MIICDYAKAIVQAAQEREDVLNSNRHRLGRFSVSRHIVELEVFPEILEKMEFVPVKVEFNYRASGELFDYVGFSPQFRELEQSELTPEYELKIVTNDSGSVDEVVAEEVSRAI